jgi:CO dehydrogenase/acetyl-CoA synthase beta subunit
VALDLGHPRTASESFVLLTTDVDAVVHGRIRWLGSDLPELPARSEHAHAQVVILRGRADALPDPFAVEAAQYLTHRLDGYMVRSVPGRLWVRISRAARARGLDFETVGRALVASYADGFPEIEAVEAVFVTGSVGDVRALAPIAAEARVMAGSHRKLVLAPDGEFECDDLDCDSCEEEPVCDSLREVVIKRRHRGPQGVEAPRP